jgi:genome maintenance exonuclease 1
MVDPRLALDLYKAAFVPLFSETTVDGSRKYVTPSGKSYPSVTTILGSIKNEHLEQWKARIGEEKAEEIKNAACNRGSKFHHLVEDFYEGKKIDLTEDNPGVTLFKIFRSILPKLQPLELELPLWSDYLQTAGRADCIGYYEGELSLVDFKTSRTLKSADRIENYFLQATIYSLMLFEKTKIDCKQIVILISTEEGFPQVFKRMRNDYIKKAVNIIRSYYADK